MNSRVCWCDLNWLGWKQSLGFNLRITVRAGIFLTIWSTYQLFHKDHVSYSKLLICGCWSWGPHYRHWRNTRIIMFYLASNVGVSYHFHFRMCLSFCNWSCSHIQKFLSYRKPRLKSNSTKRKTIVEEKMMVVMIVVLCEVFLPVGGTCVALALPSFHWLSFLTFPLSFPERLLQFWVWTITVAKFVFGLLVLNSLSLGTYWVSVPILVFGSESCIVSSVLVHFTFVEPGLLS